MTSRHCGSCTLCCKLLPVTELQKGANTRCQHQRHRKGCAIYGKAPLSCRVWSCRWLVDDTTADLRRPDNAGYVIDIMPDFVTVESDGSSHKIPVIQVWADPKRPAAHRDKDLRSWLAGHDSAALVRMGAHDAILLVPPSISDTNEWAEHASYESGAPHSAREIMECNQKWGRKRTCLRRRSFGSFQHRRASQQ